jgi:SAM-dependent methyltransferase
MMLGTLRVFAALCLTCAAACACSATPAAQHEPKPGQQGKDVVWIPSPEGMVELMLDTAGVTPKDFVIDLGSGDGRNVIAAAKRGARALGVEYNPDLVELSKRNAARQGVGDRASFVHGDMYQADISQASVMILFLIPQNLEKLAPRFLALKPGTRIVSNTYEIGGGWEPDDVARLPACLSWCIAHLYVVPADVKGAWTLGDGVLTLAQEFQYLYGSFDLDGIRLRVEDGKLLGNEIRFTINTVEYSGRIAGETMAGVAKGRTTRSWTATRSPD